MRHSFKLMATSALILGLASCSKDINDGPTAETDDFKCVYMTFSLENTGASRSQTNSESTDEYGTSTEGIEVGKEKENLITNVSVFLSDADGDIKASAVDVEYDSSTDKQTYTARFKSDGLSGMDGENVNVIVYCNMSGYTYDRHLVRGSVDDTSWGAGNAGDFEMTNATRGGFGFTLPSNLASHNTRDNSVLLGTIKVERSAARFDLKKGGTDGKYTLVDHTPNNGSVTLEITGFTLINMSNEWYAIRHTASTPINYRDSWELCGTETSSNFVVDSDWDTKNDYYNAVKALTTPPALNISYPMTNPSSWVWSRWTDLTESDNYGSNEYKIWRYANENTIPGADKQIKAYSTGIVFKAQITTDDTALSTSMDGTKSIYAFQGILYGSLDDVIAATASNGALDAAYQASKDAGGNFDDTLASAHGFTVYSPETDGNYYCYYYYWNQHNNNNKPSEMGVMEFSVVRNNVYKLYVESISRLGHPTPGDPDPDPENPEDPDEENELYFDVNIKVMPWVVRVNNIAF